MSEAAIEFATSMTILAAFEAAIFSAMAAVFVAVGLLHPAPQLWAVVTVFLAVTLIAGGLAAYWFTNPAPLKARIREIVVKYDG